MQMAGMDGWMLAKAIKADPLIAGTRLVMMTSLDRHEDAAAMSAAGLDAYLTKPVRHAQLFESLSMVIGTQAGRQSVAAAAPKEPAAKFAAGPNAMRVLIAEDNIVNQKVAVSQVQKLGCYADVVGNGKEALDALEVADYDVVLMDCQMPELDGYEATGRLRARETGGWHTVVVAMTAHAIEGDREKCLAAGMDDYLSKPLRIEDLRTILEKYQPAQATEEPAVEPERIEMLRELGADGAEDILTDLIDTFMGNAPELLSEAEQGLTRGESGLVARAAHTLMGSCSNFGAKPLQDLCRQLEALARSQEFEGSANGKTNARQLLSAILEELSRVGAALDQYRKKP